MFKNGHGVTRDPVAALGWFICAALSDSEVGKDAARWVEQLSSSLDGASVSVAQERARDCRTTAENPARPDTSDVSERAGSGPWIDWESFELKLDQIIQELSQVDIAKPQGPLQRPGVDLH